MKSPCVDCNRCYERSYSIWEQTLFRVRYFCLMNHRLSISGQHMLIPCALLRRTPFCKFKPKDDEE